MQYKARLPVKGQMHGLQRIGNQTSLFIKMKTFNFAGREYRKASIRTLPAGGRAHPVPRQFPTPAASLVHAVLLPQLDQRLLAHHGADSLRGQGAFLHP